MSLLEEKIKIARRNLVPLFATLEITQLCNLSCKHCYNFDRSKNDSIKSMLSQPNKLTLEKIKEVILELRELGGLSINLSGGEPLLHPDINEIIKFSKSLNFQTRIKSNGLLLTEELANSLFENGLNEIDISMYGSNEREYISFCGKEGHYLTIAAIRNAQKAKIKVNVSLILHRYNYKNLANMISTLESLGVFYHISDEITDRYDKTKAQEALGLKEEHYLELLNGPYSYFFSHENSEKNLMCGCAKTVVGIDFLGNVYPCIGAPILSGNVWNTSLKTIWKTSEEFTKIRKLESKDFHQCQNCDLITQCSRSSGAAYINTNDYTGCDPTALEHARARSKFRKNFT